MSHTHHPPFTGKVSSGAGRTSEGGRDILSPRTTRICSATSRLTLLTTVNHVPRKIIQSVGSATPFQSNPLLAALPKVPTINPSVGYPQKSELFELAFHTRNFYNEIRATTGHLRRCNSTTDECVVSNDYCFRTQYASHFHTKSPHGIQITRAPTYPEPQSDPAYRRAVLEPIQSSQSNQQQLHGLAPNDNQQRPHPHLHGLAPNANQLRPHPHLHAIQLRIQLCDKVTATTLGFIGDSSLQPLTNHYRSLHYRILRPPIRARQSIRTAHVHYFHPAIPRAHIPNTSH